MNATNIVAHQVASYGVRTFSAKEMAFNILGLIYPPLFSVTQAVMLVWTTFLTWRKSPPKSEPTCTLSAISAALPPATTRRTWGSRTRWKMEATGESTIEGCIEMAWITGHQTFDGKLKSGAFYVGWVDAPAKTGEPVNDKDVKGKYEKVILEHAGIRLIGT